MALGQRLGWVLDQMNMSQTALAEAINVPPQTIHRIISADQKKTEYSTAIAKRLNLNITWFTTGNGEPFATDKAERIQELASLLKEDQLDLFIKMLEAAVENKP